MTAPFATPSLLLLPLLLAPEPRAQESDVLARFQLDGKPAVVTRADVALEMALHLRRRERGRQACDLLVDATLTRRAAERLDLMPTREEVEAFWKKLQDELRAAGRRPEDFPAVRNTSQQQWRDDLAVQIAQVRLVQKELDLGPDEEVSPDMLRLWLQEERKKRDVVVDPDQLPTGVCARIGADGLPLIDLGFLLLRTSEDAERDRFVRQEVYLRAIESQGRQHGIRITEADLDAEIARRRAEAARDPRYRGAGLEQLLEAEGLTIQSLRELRVFRAQVLLTRLAETLFPDGELTEELQRDRQQVLDLVGPRRRLAVVFVRALDEPNALVPRDFVDAEQKLREVRARLAEESWETVATIESEDNATKANGGDAGWHRRRSDRLPEPVVAAAFALAEGAVSQPVRSEEGCWLVKVVAVEPPPADAELIANLREHKALEFSQRLLRDAQIEMVGPEPRPR